ncbi:carboxylate-amine ligase [Yinghuangia soli]|uniref:Putative glutamate--cysteine ligase 2 n=1 Tax=Yinghuangia soli TaxID=2908204 RepID=A0AA41Q9K6_9ACTN|nr:glutamate--cysteine ligase [Yinghuangia soli]MCF2533435.1 glutamate--cysteine ligase [Yinghuangia soli]
MPFDAVPGVLTVGVEEEFFLVDRTTRRTVPRAPDVLAWGQDVLDDRLQGEFLRTQVETVSEPAGSLPALLRDLAALHRGAAAAAASADCRLVASGTPVLRSMRSPALTRGPRYRGIADRVAGIVGALGDGLCGCHVHLGIGDREEAVRVAAHLRPWLPTIQALTANSPFWQGEDTGYAAWRLLQWGKWPTVEPTPAFPDAAAYDAALDSLVDSGTLLDRRMVYWYARLSERYPTLEIRIADSNADLGTTLLAAALLRGLCGCLLDDVRAGRDAPDVPDHLLRAAHWRAARDGLAGTGIDLATGHLVPARRLARALLLRARPGLQAAGDFATAAKLLGNVLRRGDAAQQQRAAYRRRGRLPDVVDMLADRTEAAASAGDARLGPPLGPVLGPLLGGDAASPPADPPDGRRA